MGAVMRMLEDVDLGVLIGAVGRGVAEAQAALDLSSIRVAEAMAANPITFDGESISVLELGFIPNFYQFTETTIEIKISMSVAEEKSEERNTSESKTESETTNSLSIGWFSVSSSSKTTTKTTSVDARFSSRFQYSAEASSRVATRLVPVPPPAALLALTGALVAESIKNGGV